MSPALPMPIYYMRYHSYEDFIKIIVYHVYLHITTLSTDYDIRTGKGCFSYLIKYMLLIAATLERK